MYRINVRFGYTAPVKAKTTSWALLAWYLDQIDPYADHPDAGASIAGPNSARALASTV